MSDLTINDSVNAVSHALRNSGKDQFGNKLTIQDAIATPNAPLVFKQVITQVLQEAIEPTLIGARFLQKINFDGYGQQVTFGTLGHAGIANLDMAEGQEYPEFSIQAGSGTVTANIGKCGLKLKITDEMVRYSQWDLIGLHIKQAGYALARHKEQKIFNLLNSVGTLVFDNASPTSAAIGRTSGRGLDGTGNGSFTMDDLYDMYAKTMENGFTPDTILVHPLAWAAFVKDPNLRAIALNTGNMSDWYTSMPRNVSPMTPDLWKQLGRMGPATSAPSEAERVGTQQSAPVLPSYLPFGGIRIVPSHMVPFNSATRTTSLIMLDSREVGALVVAEDPTIEQWRDASVDINLIKMRERYGLALFNEGNAVSVARNVSIDPNQIVLPPQATIADVPEIVRK